MPAAHASHGPPSFPVNPAWHVQLATLGWPPGDVVYAGQALQVVAARLFWKLSGAQKVQGAEPAAALYCPAEHAWHGPPWRPVYPAVHTQSVFVVLPTELFENSGHE